MKVYKICDTATERIEFRANDDNYALVQKVKHSDTYKTIILNQREVLNIY